MKFGYRTPSLNKRIAARTSVPRYLAHSLGFKVPRGLGLLTNPKKAAYNRVYNKTTIDPLKMPQRRQATQSGEIGNGSVSPPLLILTIVIAMGLYRLFTGYGGEMSWWIIAALIAVILVSMGVWRDRQERQYPSLTAQIKKRREVFIGVFGLVAIVAVVGFKVSADNIPAPVVTDNKNGTVTVKTTSLVPPNINCMPIYSETGIEIKRHRLVGWTCEKQK